MNSRTAAVVSRGLLVLAVAMMIGSFAVASPTDAHPVTAPVVVGDATVADGPDALAAIKEHIAEGTIAHPSTLRATNVIAFLLLLGWMMTGSLIVSRQPRNLAGWLFVAIGFAGALSGFAVAMALWGTVGEANVPLLDLFAILSDDALLPVLLLPLLFLLFPDGHPPPRWRWVAWTMLAGLALVALSTLVSPGPMNNLVDAGVLYANPIGITALAGAVGMVSTVGGLMVLVSALATVPAVWGRYRGSTGELRQQLRWLVTVAILAGALLVLGILTTIVGSSFLPENSSVFISLLLALVFVIALGVPAAYLVAIFRYGLWDLDIVIRKTVLYVVVAVILVAIFGVATLVLGGLIGLTGALDSDTGATVAAVIAGVLIWPAVRVARRVADRVVYGGRATPYEVLTGFTGKIGDTYATDDVLARMAQVLAEGTGASSASVQLRVGTELRELASFGSSAGDETIEPVSLHGVEIGALAVTMPPNDPINPTKERLMRDLAAQAGPVLRNVQLIEDLRASRQRLVAAQDEERRKLERNIHDGVQQQLVALAVKLKLADAMLDRDPAKAHEALAGLQADAGTALEDLRDLARGIYPPLLADRGLATALEAQARKAVVPTTVEAEGVGRFPQEVEAAVYFSCLEALQNVAKYAEATSARISLSNGDGMLRFAIVDDGRGFDAAATSYGTGLQGMADRLDAIGGTLTVTSRPSEGTTVAGSVPAEAAS